MLRLLRSIPQLIAEELDRRTDRITYALHSPHPDDDGPICPRCSLATNPIRYVRWPCPPVQERQQRPRL